ncbi:uncharacterized protein LOC143649415 [Tamandua tetradactyla]|uniref:uncharacterized protein LOC143649415 n=1 Tax=Tamandua tetradactyla TaxID=48850 RepID=UPI00405468AD
MRETVSISKSRHLTGKSFKEDSEETGSLPASAGEPLLWSSSRPSIGIIGFTTCPADFGLCVPVVIDWLCLLQVNLSWPGREIKAYTYRRLLAEDEKKILCLFTSLGQFQAERG